MNNWKQDSLTNHVSLITKGTTPTSIGKEFHENGINFIKAESITDAGEFISSAFAFIDDSTYKILKRSQLQDGDILFSIAGVLGRVAVVNKGILPANTNQAIAIIRLSSNSEIENDFLKHLLNSEFVKEQIRRINVQAAQANFSLADINRLQIQFPEETKEQTKITRILSTADAVIEKTQAAIAKYKAIKQGMLPDLFTRGIDLSTCKLRPRYEDAPELYKDSKLGMIPMEWDEKSIESIGEIVTGSTPPTAKSEYYGNEYLFVSPADIQDNFYINETEKKLTKSGFDVCRKLPENSICVVCIGSTIGKMALLAKEGCTNQQINSVICFDPELSFYFFYAMLFYNEPQFRKETGLQAVPIVNKSQFSEFILPTMEKTEALLIAERLKAIDNKLQTEQTYLQKMQSLKKGLMEDLLSGKKHVKVSQELVTQNEN